MRVYIGKMPVKYFNCLFYIEWTVIPTTHRGLSALSCVACEDFEPDASDGRQQVSVAACSDAGRNSRNAQKVFRSDEVAKRQRWPDAELYDSVSVFFVVLDDADVAKWYVSDCQSGWNDDEHVGPGADVSRSVATKSSTNACA